VIRILCLGDVVGAPGRELLSRRLPDYRREKSVDFVVANVENVAEGSGVTSASYRLLRGCGVDVCTTGDHVFKRSEILKIMAQEPDRILRPANYPAGAAGAGFSVVPTAAGIPVAVLNLQGRVFMDPADDPFRLAEESLAKIEAKVVVVDMHAEATSEKRAMGWFLDGRASIVFGTHTHVPTADEEILTKGTAYITDLGMCGPYRSVIGRSVDPVVRTFTTRMYHPFSVATEDVRACGILVDVDESTGRALALERVRITA
jgi:hypothetical protein